MLADDEAEQGISSSVHVHALQRDQHYHLAKIVHDCHDGIIATKFRQVHDEVDMDLLPRGLQEW